MQALPVEATRRHIEADIRHLRSVMGRIEQAHYPSADDMRLRSALRWAMARKKRILRRLQDRPPAVD